MRYRFLPLTAGFIASVFALATPGHDAHACGGGTFYPTEDQTSVGLVNGHRVVLSLSAAQTVLWDQITYTGDPKDFTWVMPVPPGSTLDVASDAWLEALDATTGAIVASPEIDCPQEESSGCACGSLAGARDGSLNGGDGSKSVSDVTVVHQSSVGPYQTVTIKSETPGAIGQWLTDNGFKISASVTPILDDYAAKGMDFIALRLKSAAQAVAQMQAVRVTMPGSITTFPMRMLSAGAQASVALKVFVISESRVQVGGFPSAEIDPKELSWDFAEGTSNYPALRAKALAAAGGKAWFTIYARQGSLLSPPPADERFSRGEVAMSIADAYFLRGTENSEIPTACSLDPKLATSAAKVVDLCANGEPCAMLGADEIDARTFDCGKLEDLSVALTGLHPKDAWVSRFEADLPREALMADLTFEPLTTTEPVENRFTSEKGESLPEECTIAAMAAPGELSPPARPPSRRDRMAMFLSLLAVAAVVLRRAAARAGGRANVAGSWASAGQPSASS
jgi:hypothetical protein